jgi:hypothetical protein
MAELVKPISSKPDDDLYWDKVLATKDKLLGEG